MTGGVPKPDMVFDVPFQLGRMAVVVADRIRRAHCIYVFVFVSKYYSQSGDTVCNSKKQNQGIKAKHIN